MKQVMLGVGQVFHETASRFPFRPALTHLERGLNLSYAELDGESAAMMRGLMVLGIDKGDRIAVFAPNIPQWIIFMLAIMRMGAVLVPVDPDADENMLLHMLNTAECRAVITSEGNRHSDRIDRLLAVCEKISSLDHIITAEETHHVDTSACSELVILGESLAAGAETAAANHVKPEDPAAIMFTSGTTGLPKGVLLDHQGLVNKSFAATARQGISHEDRLCLFFPLSHMFGNTCIALAGLLRGSHLVMPGEIFEPASVNAAIASEKCTAVYGSPGMLSTLIDSPGFDPSGWSGLTRGIIGGAPCPMDLMKRLVENLGIKHLTVGYGITEASSWITMTMPEDPLPLRVGTIGRALPCNEVRIVNPATGHPLPPGERGELCTKGFLMKGYWKRPAATEAAVDPEGWFHTGDLGEMDESGYIRVTGRIKDVIIRDGIEIHPVELEEVIHELPGVSQAQVFGFNDPSGGTGLAAWVIPREGHYLREDEIESHLISRVDRSLLPSQYRIVEEFPTTASGKVQKARLAERAEKTAR